MLRDGCRSGPSCSVARRDRRPPPPSASEFRKGSSCSTIQCADWRGAMRRDGRAADTAFPLVVTLQDRRRLRLQSVGRRNTAAAIVLIEVIVALQLSMRTIGGRQAALTRQRVLSVC